MRVVFKYLLAPNITPVMAPKHAIPLKVGAQEGKMYLWMEVDTDQLLTEYHYSVFGTGHNMFECTGTYVDTVFMDSFVFHIYIEEH